MKDGFDSSPRGGRERWLGFYFYCGRVRRGRYGAWWREALLRRDEKGQNGSAWLQ